MKHLFTIVLLSIGYTILAQGTNEQLSEKLVKIDSTVSKIGKLLNILSEFQVAGYVQTQWQRADSTGIRSVAFADFPAGSNNRFSVRRGRLKVGFDHWNQNRHFRLFEFRFQMDMSERGFLARDIYGRVVDPWTGWIGIQAGLMDRPFGYELRTADDFRESPERGRMSQFIFPLEKDLGAALVIRSPDSIFKLFNIRIDAGLFNGNGEMSAPFAGRKDFIGSIKVGKKLEVSPKLAFRFSGGASMYYGNRLQKSRAYGLEPNNAGALVYTLQSDTTNINKKYFPRRYYGVDLQLSAEYKLGATTLRGEFIAGHEPGTFEVSITASTLTVPYGDLYQRKFNGAYFYFVQTFKHKIKNQPVAHELVVKYDWYTPNSQISPIDMSSVNDSKLGFSDLKFQTIGFGYNFKPADYFLIMFYYDYVINSATNIKGFTSDLADNVFTIRTQIKFDTDWFNKKVREAKF